MMAIAKLKGMDPTTADVHYDHEQVRWLKACEGKKQAKHVEALSPEQYLKVAASLGYTVVINGQMFTNIMTSYRRENRRFFPTHCEHLALLKMYNTNNN